MKVAQIRNEKQKFINSIYANVSVDLVSNNTGKSLLVKQFIIIFGF